MSLLANQRARTATEIVDASVQFYRAHAAPLLTIAALVTIPLTVVRIFLPQGISGLIGLLENVLLTIGGAAASLYVTAVMTEGEISFGDAFGRVSGRLLGKVLVAQILFGVTVLLGALLLVIPGLVFATRFALATTVAAVEGIDGGRAMNRSWALTKGHGWHVFGTVAITFIVAFLVVGGGAFLVGMLSDPLGLDERMTELLSTPLTTLVMPLVWVAVTLLYVDIRVRVEGADIEAMVAELPRPSAGAPTTTS